MPHARLRHEPDEMGKCLGCQDALDSGRTVHACVQGFTRPHEISPVERRDPGIAEIREEIA